MSHIKKMTDISEYTGVITKGSTRIARGVDAKHSPHSSNNVRTLRKPSGKKRKNT